MKDLISRQAVIDELMNNESIMGVPWVDENGDPINDMDERREIIAEWLSRVPSAQPEIIRCKDCKRYGQDNCFMKIQMLWELKPDDFCSQAERKTE